MCTIRIPVTALLSGPPAKKSASLRVLVFFDHQKSPYGLYTVGRVNNIHLKFKQTHPFPEETSSS